MKLPEAFLIRMKALLGDEYDAFLASYDEPCARGLRINPAKISAETFEAEAPFPVRRVPWVANGYFYPDDVRPAAHPFYQAGLYYLQEPSAMTPGDRLDVCPGDRVLDLCAAPGGKATQLSAKMRMEGGSGGLLVANEISNARAKALLRNLELSGARDFFVTNERPDRLAKCFSEFFDRILIDAPCSGEGMFRRQKETADAWSPDKVRSLSALQRQILGEGYRMLRPGGTLLYSTCTFSPAENEANVAEFLLAHPDMKLIPIRPYKGFCEGRPDWAVQELLRDPAEYGLSEQAIEEGQTTIETVRMCVRIWPHKMEGEGHFLALMRKDDAVGWRRESGRSGGHDRRRGRGRDFAARGGKPGRENGREEKTGSFRAFLSEMNITLPAGRTEARGGRVYLVPELPQEATRLKFLRSGVYLGDLKKDRFEPSQPFALILSENTCGSCLSFRPDDPALRAFLAGEPVRFTEDEMTLRKDRKEDAPGWKLVLAGRYPVGWGKLAAGVLKNKIPVSWRTDPKK